MARIIENTPVIYLPIVNKNMDVYVVLESYAKQLGYDLTEYDICNIQTEWLSNEEVFVMFKLLHVRVSSALNVAFTHVQFKAS